MKIKNNQAKLYEIDPKVNNDLENALDEENVIEVSNIAKKLEIKDIADFLTTASPEQRIKFIEIVNDEFNPKIIIYLKPDLKNIVIKDLGIRQTARIINKLDVEGTLQAITDLEKKIQRQILVFIDKEKRKILEEVLSYPEDSAGRLIRKKWITVNEEWRASQVLDLIKIHKNIPEKTNQVFVVDEKMKPLGFFGLSKLIKSSHDAKVTDIMSSDIKLIRADMDQEEVGYIFRKHKLLSAPVVNEKDRIVGIITIEDIIGVIKEEADEDFLHFGGIYETDIHLTYLQTIAQRFPWLFINILLSILTSIVIGLFQDTLDHVIILAVLMPIIASISGNSGIQTVTVTVRSISTRELKRINLLRIIGKEIMVGLINGLILALLCFCIVLMRFGDFHVSVLFSVSIVLTFVLASLAGSSIPILLNAIGVDPAIASSVVLTTFTDIVSFSIFLGLASCFLF